jgi:hypothetical protein
LRTSSPRSFSQAADPGPVRVYKPAPSRGTLWLAGLAAALVAIPVAQYYQGRTGFGLAAVSLLTGAIAVWMLLLAYWLPTMRYELDQQALTVVFGPVLRWRIPLREIRGVELKDLTLSIWAATRLPGIAVFSVYYGNVGVVRMCATRASKRIVLIHTAKATYGLTPDEQEEFTRALQARAHG